MILFAEPMIQILKKTIFFVPLLILALVGSLAVAFQPIFGPVDPQTIDRALLVRLMQLRDFRTFPPETLVLLTERADLEFGKRSEKMPEFRYSALEKKIYSYFQQNRAEGVRSCFESNLISMARTRYFEWMDQIETLSAEEQATMLSRIADEMKWWETLYMNFLKATDLPIPSIAQLIKECNEMIEGFKVGASPKDAARIETFKQRMNLAIVAKEVQGRVQKLSSSNSLVSDTLGSFLKLSPKKKESTGKSKVDSPEKSPRRAEGP